MISAIDIGVAVGVGLLLLPVVAIGILLARYLGLWQDLQHAGRAAGVRWWDAVGPFALFVGLLTVVWLTGDIPAEGEPGYLSFVFGAALATLGAVGVTLALGNFDEHRQLQAAVDSAGGVDTGPALLSGEARADGEPLKGALSDEPAVVQTLRITERRGFGYRKTRTERHFERSKAPFRLDDGTGAVVVDPTDGAVRYEGSRDVPDARLSLPPETDDERTTVERIAQRTGISPDDDQRYTESRIEPGADVTVLGSVAHDPEARYPVVGDGDRRLVVFEGDIDDARSSVANRVRYGATAALVCLPGGTAWMLSVAGVL